ncbi:hypothetical protein [Nonomuraea soli]|uniref:Uncharacterized protein n=1 Tax=Nonomuraea soli TaxID=1032476 RepID=A0A7W0CLB8_9ACTN|nr:hypothetical protein [Nonomuraea soli]MBA2893307.1 hypothetical protein [Nonomuraea soli]
MIALTRFRLTAYVRSHRVYQALLPILIMLAILHSNVAPAGKEAAVLADSAALMIPFLAWAARSVLDTEPDGQRVISATSVGGPSREVAAGLLAALGANVLFAAVALAAALVIGIATPITTAVLAAGVALHLIAALTGTALGALTSRAILPSPAISIMVLILGYIVMLLVGRSSVYWLTVPVTGWMKAANDNQLVEQLPLIAGISVVWLAAAFAGYAQLRRTRP